MQIRSRASQLAASLAVTAAAAGCGEGGVADGGGAGSRSAVGDSDQISLLCDEISGGGTRAKLADGGCPSCARDEQLSVDGLLDSFATLRGGPGGGPVAISAVAQPGVVFPEGAAAGVVLSADTPDAVFDIQIALSYRAEFVSSQCYTVVTDQADQLSILAADSPDLFDSVELTLFPTSDGSCGSAAESASTESVTLRVHEFCSDVAPG